MTDYLDTLYGTSLALLTDLYQLTMAYGYWKSGRSGTEATFNVAFRENPFGGGYTVAAGLEPAIDYLERLRFDASDIAYLREQTGNDGRPLFDEEFLAWLAGFRFTCDVDAVAEGTVVFPDEPLVRVSGPIVQAQLVETALLCIVNFQTLIATKAARVCSAAAGQPVVEFGLRRAQGPDGGVSASRAAYIGGCAGTSNTLASKLFGIPAKGTHAHSWVMAFGSEIEAFEAYAAAEPNNCTFLVDTYDTLEGVRHAVEVGRRLREIGHEMIGIRIDSGDLAWLSEQARAILDEGGFPSAIIMASNELDEHVIDSLKEQGAPIDAWGVGTHLATGWGQPALGGVYKLSAAREPGGEWEPRLKVTEQLSKVSTPGILGVRRYLKPDGTLDGDMVYDMRQAPPQGAAEMISPYDPTKRKRFAADAPFEELLVPVFRAGERVYDAPPLAQVRDRAAAQLARLDPTRKRLLNPHTYPVGLEKELHALRTRLILELRGAR
jgi:nicotinate phosphoribosyltransferase